MKLAKLRFVVVALTCASFAASPLQGADNDGRWGLGVHGGLYKLVLSDHSDAWTGHRTSIRDVRRHWDRRS